MRSTAGRRGEQVRLPPHASVGAHGEGGREGVLTDEVLDLLDPRPKVGLPLDRVLRTTRGKAFQSDSTGRLSADALLLVRCRGLTREKGVARASCTLRARARTGRAGPCEGAFDHAEALCCGVPQAAGFPLVSPHHVPARETDRSRAGRSSPAAAECRHY